jgi:pyruvate/2-oxoglutarate dehydrogenase complex dihydrolipoamide acyltransferase (E2) component
VVAGLIVAAAMVAGCGQDAAAPAEPSPTTSSPPATTAHGAWDAPAAVQAALADLSERTGAARAAVDVVQVRQRTWPGSLLTCGPDRRLAADGQVRGFEIVFRVEGEDVTYRHRADPGPGPTLLRCPQPPTPLGPKA